jgi:hypothetical protein
MGDASFKNEADKKFIREIQVLRLGHLFSYLIIFYFLIFPYPNVVIVGFVYWLVLVPLIDKRYRVMFILCPKCKKPFFKKWFLFSNGLWIWKSVCANCGVYINTYGKDK